MEVHCGTRDLETNAEGLKHDVRCMAQEASGSTASDLAYRLHQKMLFRAKLLPDIWQHLRPRRTRVGTMTHLDADIIESRPFGTAGLGPA